MRVMICIACLLGTFSVQAELLPPLPSEQVSSSHQLFLTSEQNSGTNDNQSINIDGGYSYNLFSDIDIYVGARIKQSDNSNNDSRSENGFLSGVSYQVTERVSIRSMVHSYYEQENDKKNNTVAAELSSRLQLTDDLDLHATLDYREWQQGVEVGLGFRF